MPATAREKTQKSDIEIGAETLDQVYQARDEGQETLRTAKGIEARLRQHEETIAGRHKAMLASLAQISEAVEQVAAMAARNSARLDVLEEFASGVIRERENWEDEIKMLHGTLRGWYRAMEAVLKRLNMEAELEQFPPPGSLPHHYLVHGTKKAS